jgi:glutamate-1-semialdehyde 2,1-aminomutase
LLFQNNEKDIAAIIVEPVAANMGVVLPKKGFLEELRSIADEYGALLIFDEVITGFRLSLGGAQAFYGIKPDLTTLGKIVGGGMPLAVYGGRADVMKMVAPVGSVYQAGTLSGNPVATTAGIETLKLLISADKDGIYEKMNEYTGKLADEARSIFDGKATVNQVGSLMSIFFTDKPVTDFESAVISDTEMYAKYFNAMLDKGIYLAPSQFEAMFVSGVHSREDFDRTVDAMNSVVCID